jgi:hypothetical protein
MKTFSLLAIYTVMCFSVCAHSFDITSLKNSVSSLLRLEAARGLPAKQGHVSDLEADLPVRSREISSSIAIAQAEILKESDDPELDLKQLSAAFAESGGESDRNPLVSGFFCDSDQIDSYISVVTSKFFTQAMPASVVYLNVIPEQSSMLPAGTFHLPDLQDTSAKIVQVPSDNSNGCLFLVHGQATRKMQYHERAAIYRLDSTGMQSVWVSGYAQGATFTVSQNRVVLKQALNLVGGDFSELAQKYPDFKGYAIRTIAIQSGSAMELAVDLVPPE